MKAEFKLNDVSDSEHANESVAGQVSVEKDNLALLVTIDGYNVHDSADEAGFRDPGTAPILLERFHGELRLIVWADINNSDPTHIISLKDARTSNRRDT